MNKQLWKSTFKSFFKNKLGIILLAVIVFLTAGMFTLLESTQHSFITSYNNVVEKGNLHDFTVKERYSNTGKLNFKADQVGGKFTETGIANTDHSGLNTVDGLEYIYFTASTSPIESGTSSWMEQSHDGVPIRINWHDAKSHFVDSNNDGTYDSINGGVKFEIVTPKHSTIEDLSKIGEDDIKDLDVDFMNSASSKYIISNPHFILQGPAHTHYVTLKKADSFSSNGFIGSKVSESTIKNKLLSIINKAGTIVTADYANVKISADASTATGSYLEFLKTNNYDKTVKVIYQSNPNNYLNDSKVVSAVNDFRTQIDTKINEGASTKFVNKVMAKYGNALEQPKRVNTLSVDFKDHDGQKVMKIVDNGDLKSKTDKIVLFKGRSIRGPDSIANMDAQALKLKNEMLKTLGVIPDSVAINKTKGWKYTITGSKAFIGKAIPLETKFVVDTSSFEAVLSPGYAKEHHKEPIDQDVLKSKDFIDMANDVTGAATKEFKNKYDKNVVMVDDSLFVVTGIGVTPDFSYPIIDNRNPVVNSKNQAVLFTNRNGFLRMEDAFRTNPHENYLAFSFKKDFNGNKKAIMDGIEDMATNPTNPAMSWPSNINSVSAYNDTSEKVIMAPQRIAFLEKLNHTIKFITYLVVASLILLASLIVMLIIKRNIASQRRTLAILNANGYTKRQIAASFVLVGLMIVGIATIVGYIVGFSLQFAFIKIFANYWTLPVYKQSFSIVSLVATVLVPIVATSILVFVIALWELRGNVLKNMNDVESKFGQAMTAKSVSMFRWFGIKTKLSVSFLFTNLSKMVMILVATTGAVVASTVAITTFGKFDKAVTETNTVNNYEYAVDLVSPSTEGGQYHAEIYEDPNTLGNKYAGKPTRIWAGMEGKIRGQVSASELGKSYMSFIHAPSTADGGGIMAGVDGWGKDPAKGVGKASTYLKNRVQFKFILNAAMKAFSIGVVPWDVAKGLMPSNQIATANRNNKVYVSDLIKFYESKTTHSYTISATILKAMKDYVKIHSSSASEAAAENKLQSVIVGGLFSPTFKVEVQELIADAWKSGVIPYHIVYNGISMNNDDETYSSLRGDVSLKNIKNENILINLSIKGINSDTKYINSPSLKNIFNSSKKWKTGDVIPVVVNKYMNEYYKLSVGSYFNMKVNNTADRFKNKALHLPQPTKRFKVVGIANSYSGNEIFTSHEIANKVLGLDPIQGFNGLFSKETEPKSLKELNLYSPSGIYPAWDTLTSGDSTSESYKLIDYILKNKGKIAGIPDNAFWRTNIYNPVTFAHVYSSTPYMATVSDVDWAKMSRYTFESVNQLSGNLIWMAEGLALIIALIFIIIIGSMMVNANKRNISTLKVLGYRNGEIRNAFIKSMLPSLLIGILISIPIIFAILIAMKIAIMSFGAVLIPLNMIGWEFIAASAVVVISFLLIFIKSISSLKGQSALEAFKE